MLARLDSIKNVNRLIFERGGTNIKCVISEKGLHCRNCDSLTVVAVAHFDPLLAGRHLAAIGRADDRFCRLQFWFVLNIFQNKLYLDPRSLKKLICS